MGSVRRPVNVWGVELRNVREGNLTGALGTVATLHWELSPRSANNGAARVLHQGACVFERDRHQ